MAEYALVGEAAGGNRAVIRLETFAEAPEDPVGKGWKWLPVVRPSATQY